MSRLARATAVMTAGTVLSRFTGLLRLAAIAAALGVVESGRLTDAYNYANTAPNIIYELALGGVLTSVFVPVFVDLLEKEGREEAWKVASAILNVSVVVLTAISVIGILAAPLIAKLYTVNVNFDPERQREIMTFWLRLFVPQIIFYGITAITAGLLNAHQRFGAPMYTPILNNLAVIVVFIGFYKSYGAVDDGSISGAQLTILGIGTTAGVALMALAQLPFLRGLGRYRLTFSITHPSVRKLARLSVFVLAYVITNQIGYVIVQVLANGGGRGDYTAYTWAFTFFMLPHGLFAVSVITALLPSMSEHASNTRWDEYIERLSVGVRATFFLILPAAIGYFILGLPIVRLLLQHGVMSGRSTELVASVLRFFVIGLVPFSLFQLFLRAFYALHDTRTPFYVNVAAVTLNTIINFALYPVLGVKGLAVGLAAAYTFGSVIQARTLRRRLGHIDGGRIAASAGRVALAGLGMGLVVWATYALVTALIAPTNLLAEVAQLGIPVVVGLVSYIGLTLALGVRELDFIRGVLGRRFVRR